MLLPALCGKSRREGSGEASGNDETRHVPFVQERQQVRECRGRQVAAIGQGLQQCAGFPGAFHAFAVHDGVFFGQFAHFYLYHSIHRHFLSKTLADFHGFSGFVMGLAKTAKPPC